MLRLTSVLLVLLLVACSAPAPTPTATPVPTATATPTPTATPVPPTPTPIPVSELRRQGLTYRDGGLTCGDLDGASYVSVTTDNLGMGNQTSRHAGLDFHVVVAQPGQHGATENMEIIVMGDESYIRTTRTQPSGEITVLDDWASPSPFPLFSNAEARRCLDASSYDASVVDPNQPHAQTTDENPFIPAYAEVKRDWWGDAYGRPTRRVETWIPKASLEGVPTLLLDIEFRDYGADHVVAAP